MKKLSGTGKRKIRSSIGTNWKWPAWNYNWILYGAAGAALLLVIAKLFYDRWEAALVLSPLLVPFCRVCDKRRREREKKILAAQFKDLQNSVLTGLKAGYSPENAFREAYPEMVFEFGEKSVVCRSLRRILIGLDNRIPLEQLLQQFAGSSGVEEIEEFAEVFAITKKSGGSMTEVLGRSIHLIQSRMEVESEIAVMISSKKLEQYIMDAVPILIVLYIRMTSKGFFNVLYGNIVGIAVMSACLVAYMAALYLSERIMNIKV